MRCGRCASDEQKNFNGELVLHFPGREGLDKPVVWVFPKVTVCLHCGLGQLDVPDEEKQQLIDVSARARGGRSSGQPQ
jgi:hypothetical protein